MGLFDFITKTSGSNSNAQQDDSAQNPQGYQTQQDDRLVQTPFSEVKYPLPVEQQQQNLEQKQASEFENQEYNNQYQTQQYTQNQPNDFYDQNYNYQQENSMQFPVQDSQNNQFQQNYSFQDQGLNQNPDQFANPAPQENSLQFPVQETATEMQVPAVDSQQQTQQQDYLQYSPQFEQNSVQETPLQQNQEELPPLPDINSIVQEEPAQPEPAVQEPVAQETLAETPVKQESTDVENNNEPPQDLVIGTENLQNENEELPQLGEHISENVAETTSSGDFTKTAEVNENDNSVVKGGPQDEVDLDTEIFNDIKNAVKDEYEKDQVKEMPEVNLTQNEITESESDSVLDNNMSEQTPAPSSAAVPVTTESMEEESKAEPLNVFKNIAIVGLNVQNSDQSVSEKLMELVRLLSTEKTSFILDSGKGYGENLLNKLLERKDTKITGAYLKPFYSDYSDEPKAKINTESYSTAIFSNLDLKLKYLIKSADIFVMPYTSGLSNISLLFALVANSYLYYGQHKPLILLGKEWKTTVESLKSTLNLSDVESEQFVVCDEPSDVLALIRKLDKEYSEKSSVSVNKVIDMRNESDESEYFVNNI